ncbi:PqqD family peptide modification chaperone [Microbacterium oleivorans]|uniref:PqqD family peptide modification chaperone n=1 Tax=Microbacterium oleivorans TaxID=273677 RepID=A0A7D5IQG0_9MICO|nr:PqqD family peptide modification chaperone [Microbacterium oleivorans]QLD12239.1 PqqD family peptide modification chaperone [Microbacterium oleivorans]
MPPLPLVAALGCAVRLEAGSRPPGEVAAISRAWGDATVGGADPLPARHLSVTVGEGPLEAALAGLSQAVTLAAIEARRGELWMLHAGAVADEHGNVVAIVGPSGRGKTTATRALGAHFGYVTDETLAVAPDGTVLPYRKPLSIIEDAAADKAQRSASELGLGPLPPAALRLSAIVLLDRVPGGSDEPVVTPFPLVEALPELVEQTSYLGELPEPLTRIAAHAAAVGGIHRVTYSEAIDLASALAPLFRAPGEVVLAPSFAAPARDADDTADTADAGDAAGTAGTRWFRAAHLDAIGLTGADGGQRIALLQPDVDGGATLRILDGIGPALWRAADGRAATALAAAVVAEHGTPPEGDAEVAVQAAVRALADEGVLATDASWRVRDDVAWTQSDEGAVALALSRAGSPEPVALEGTAGAIWMALATARGASERAIVRVVADGADVAADEITADVAAFLRSLRDRGLAQRFAP